MQVLIYYYEKCAIGKTVSLKIVLKNNLFRAPLRKIRKKNP